MKPTTRRALRILMILVLLSFIPGLVQAVAILFGADR